MGLLNLIVEGIYKSCNCNIREYMKTFSLRIGQQTICLMRITKPELYLFLNTEARTNINHREIIDPLL